ncbi:MAG: adenylate/guanylate cyclase domain-containing protein [Actinobacteria bacterium]|nr:adenylate/guanylate cyclase domain-containing protein [Actinomycetota bacterium]MCA1721196.1 adenylate/guanylate cyclase domain-containing protein [Actinomycetota bacterium]
MAAARDLSDVRRPYRIRFDDDGTEQQYRQWRVPRATAFARIGYIGSTPSWLLLLLAIVVLDPDAARRGGAYVAAWIAALVVLTALTIPPRLQGSVVPLAAAANCVAGFLIVWLLSDVVLTEELSQSRAGVLTAALIIVMFFGFAIFRMSPGVATIAVTPYVAFASYQLFDSYKRHELNVVEAGSLAAVQGIAYLGCLLVCIVIELVDRRAFRKDRLIEAQQRELRTSRETIRRYVPRAVVDHIVRGDLVGVDVPTRRRVTVLFADLVGFTALADRVEAEVLTDLVGDYMTAMNWVVDEHGGVVSDFTGDGLMALFGAPDEMEVVDQAVSAVRAAQAMHDRLPTLNQIWQMLGATEPMQMRVGINTGITSVGSFGSEGRATYTAIGLHTNIAARLEAHCEPGRILLSDTSWHLIKDRIACEPRGEVLCKGVHYPVRVYSPCGTT